MATCREAKKMTIITLLTDFGSFYPAQMKGVILAKAKDIIFVDIAHDIPPQDIRSGAFALLSHCQVLSPRARYTWQLWIPEWGRRDRAW